MALPIRSFRWSPRCAPALAALLLTATAAAQGLRPPPAPFENPVTAQKAILGKILFWDEQLSSDNTMSCGTCHRPGSGGADPRVGRHPGPDRAFHTPDDSLGSRGTVGSTARGAYAPTPLFGLDHQVTRRSAPSYIGAAWVSALRWDGRATETFIDPQTGQLRIMFGGALEAHAAGPPVAAAEMAFPGRTWNDVVAKLARVRPLALATDLPADVANELATDPDYGELMRRAFGDRGIDSTRVIYALATYQRTLVPDRTPWDRFVNGDPTALTSRQQAGLALFEGAAHCDRCHVPPVFTDGSFRNLGLRPIGEDPGWQLATLDPIDRGKFKVPTLRNVGLRDRFMHHGQVATLAEVVDLYDRGGGPFLDNKDPLLGPLGLSATQKAQLVDFLQNALTDPRVAAETAPFDRPTLWSERQAGPYGAGHPGSGGIVPRALTHSPLAVGNAEFRVGVRDALGGSTALVAFALARGPGGQQLGPVPIHVALTPAPLVVTAPLAGTGAGRGHATVRLPIPGSPALLGAPLHHQWLVVDPGAAGGISATSGSGGTLF